MNISHKQKVEELFEAALDCAAEEQSAFLAAECQTDPALLAEVKSLLEARASARANNFMQSPAFELRAREIAAENTAETFIGQTIGHYRILEQISAGGMGAVYRAVRDDQEYQTEVAVKLIKRGMDTDYILNRFRNERQILANLNHPNIARLLDGGTTADGLPYFVMEYIEGCPIDKYCDEHKLTIERRLELFRIVCSAVQYAHQNLVIHRDIKPSNILVTAAGIPKLLDFGIAKILHQDSDAAQTAAELRVLTPEYASPEQVKGETVNVSSDVYSLGVLLYELLSGQRPYQFKGRRSDELAKVICDQEPEKPSAAINRSKTGENNDLGKAESAKMRRRLQGDLDNIVLMAIRKDPPDRYASVEQFSEDIRRHLAGLPVIAYKPTIFYRAAKFIKRNKVSVAAAGLVAISLVGGIIATSWQAYRAETAHARAERRFEDVRRLANSFIFEINEEIHRSPIKARELLVTRALEYLDELTGEAEGNMNLQSELAAAYQKIGDIQSGLHTSNMGDTSGALKSYEKALKIYESLSAAAPDNLQFRLNLSESYLKMGDISAKTGNISAAQEYYRSAVNLNEQSVEIEPTNSPARRQLATSLLKLGQAVTRTGNLSEVLEIYRHSLAINESLAAENPADINLQFALASNFSYIGFILLAMEDNHQALDHYRKSLQISEQLLASDPGNTQARRSVRSYRHWVAISYKEIGNYPEAISHHEKSIAMTKELLNTDSTDIQVYNMLADAQMEFGKTLTRAGRTADAVANLNNAIGNYERVQKSDTKNAHARCQIYYTKLFLANALLQAGGKNEALENYEQSLGVFQELTVADPNNTEWRYYLAISHLRIGEYYLKAGDKKQALPNLKTSVLLLEKEVSVSPQNLKVKRDLATAQNLLNLYLKSQAATVNH